MEMPTALRRLMVRLDLYPDWRYRRALRREVSDWEARGKAPPAPSLLKQKMVHDYAQRYGLATLVETGTYLGAMVEACKDFFTTIYSIELQADYFLRAHRRFSRFPHVHIVRGDSAVRLPGVLEELKERSLFWLDAHYSGGLTARTAGKETPVIEELHAIFSHPVRGHVILIDDARCFDGTHDYPTLEEVERLAAARAYAMCVQDDVIRLVPMARDEVAPEGVVARGHDVEPQESR
jgi:hypothetical protein